MKEATQKSITACLNEQLFDDESDDDELYRAYENKESAESTIKLGRTELKELENLSPVSIIIVHKIQDVEVHVPFKALFDSGSDRSFIQRRCLPTNVKPKSLS